MKKNVLFLFSLLIAIGIAVFTNRQKDNLVATNKSNQSWETFIKNKDFYSEGQQKPEKKIDSPNSSIIGRSIASKESDEEVKKNAQGADRYLIKRDGRILIGDLHEKNYEDESIQIVMRNKINPKWKEVLVHDLLRFQDKETKLMIKTEYPLIKIKDNTGQYVEQLIITYILQDGSSSSFRAIVNSETGIIENTWDKTFNENAKAKRTLLTIPTENNSGVTAR